jgi:hypothetical protein
MSEFLYLFSLEDFLPTLFRVLPIRIIAPELTTKSLAIGRVLSAGIRVKYSVVEILRFTADRYAI